jgi:ABC-type bacteriocin/lantibiotic exporter with double-glycine peptidase domain
VATAAQAAWLDVPFVKQAKNGCGPASVSMVMAYWRHGAADTSEIDRVLYSRDTGTFASDMERYFRQQGFEAFAFAGEWADLEQHIAKGRPLIVCLGKSRRHYVVVAGLDSRRELVAVNDPERRKLQQIDRKSFERDWSAAGHWTLLAVPPREK